MSKKIEKISLEVEKFMNELEWNEENACAVNLYINAVRGLERELKYWREHLQKINCGITNFFIDEKSGDLISREGFNKSIAHYVGYDCAELFVRDLASISEDEIEARTIRHMFSKYTDTTIEVMEERENELLEKHIAEICNNGKKYTYGGVGAYDKKIVYRILKCKALFEMMWYGQSENRNFQNAE